MFALGRNYGENLLSMLTEICIHYKKVTFIAVWNETIYTMYCHDLR